MADSLLAHSVVALAGMAASGQPPRRGEDLLSGALPCYNYYRTADGRYLAVGALEPRFWERLCDALGRPDLKPGQFAGPVRGELQAIFGAHSSDHWIELFRDVDCCVNLVLTLDEAVQTRQTLPDVGCPAAPPGAHTDAILSAAGYSSEKSRPSVPRA
ncbi:MAG: CoA transferase, partial [Acidobacteriia bacterium]|nr:CoA transferase [Terriglobia bacterium]